MGKWEYDGKMMGKWENDGKIIGKEWHNHGDMGGNDGKMMGNHYKWDEE